MAGVFRWLDYYYGAVTIIQAENSEVWPAAMSVAVAVMYEPTGTETGSEMLKLAFPLGSVVTAKEIIVGQWDR